MSFWERVCKHYHDNRPLGTPERPSRSLKTKWGVVKHDVAKFCGVYKSVLSCRESGTSVDDILERAFELYKQRHPRQQPFVFLQCWRILKDVPRSSDSIVPGNVQAQRSPSAMPKRATTTSVQQRSGHSAVEADGDGDDVEVVPESAFLSKRLRRPQGQKSAKAMDSTLKQKEIVVRAQARATAELAAANLRKAEVLSDQAALSLFTMSNEERLSDEAREYVSLRRQEEMAKLRKRVAQERQEEEHALAKAGRLERERAEELARTQRGRVPSSPRG